MLAGPLPHRAL